VNYDSLKDEEIYGLGLEYTVWNFKGQHIPIITSEGGVGRGLWPITEILNKFEDYIGGNNRTTYAPSYSYITNTNRAFIFNSSAIGYMDFTKTE
jgi:hypothetical protein